MAGKRILTGITTTGTPHLGNYVGAIRPAIQSTKEHSDTFFFLADLHALIKCHEPEKIQKSTKSELCFNLRKERSGCRSSDPQVTVRCNFTSFVIKKISTREFRLDEQFWSVTVLGRC